MRAISMISAAAVAVLSGTAAGAVELVTNGGFQTGDFTGWTLFTTSGGSLGYSPEPRVTSFDVAGTGATDAAAFQVGEAGGASDGTDQGGGIYQNILTGAGTIDVSADIAAFLNQQSLTRNAGGGLFTVLLDGADEASYDFGNVKGNKIYRSILTFSAPVSAGSHELEILVTRHFTNVTHNATPYQFITDVTATGPAPIPEPSAWAMTLAGFGGLGGALRRRRETAGATA